MPIVCCLNVSINQCWRCLCMLAVQTPHAGFMERKAQGMTRRVDAGVQAHTGLPLELGERPRAVAEVLRLAAGRQLREPRICGDPEIIAGTVLQRRKAPQHIGQRLRSYQG